ncbi:hypothetical protein Hanom_Chr16g01503321 [Helianthus anomalus]
MPLSVAISSQIYTFNFIFNKNNNNKSKLQKSSFMYATYCKLCPFSLISTKTILDVYKPLQIMSFSPDAVIFYG